MMRDRHMCGRAAGDVQKMDHFASKTDRNTGRITLSKVYSMNAAGPHGSIPVNTPRERLLANLLDRLWMRYRARVPSVAIYEQLLADQAGTFVNDHLAFRTFAAQQPFCGIASIARLFEAFGYTPCGCYQFPDKLLSAIHLQHPQSLFPKIFVSELQTWRLNPTAATIVQRTLATHRPPLSDDLLRTIHEFDGTSDVGLVDACADWIETLPWSPPTVDDLNTLNLASQYGAWVLVHGYNVNHFTALINSQGTPTLADIEQTVAALRERGVPVKTDIEGARGSKLRQTATAAAEALVSLTEAGKTITRPWSYAYFELAERGTVVDPETGRSGRFEGFLGAQATQLFEMTRRPA